MICPACTGTGMESTDPEDASTCLRCGGSGVAPVVKVRVVDADTGVDVSADYVTDGPYEITDPKHPRHHEVMADYADLDFD